jgi:hypothetical protein
MILPAMTWGLLAMSQLGTSRLLGPIAFAGSILAALSTIGAWMMRRWTAYAFAGWALIAAAWEPGILASLGSLSIGRALGAVVSLCLMWALAVVLHQQIARYAREQPGPQPENTIVW